MSDPVPNRVIKPFNIEVDFKQKVQIREPFVTQYDDVSFLVSVLDRGEPVEIDAATRLVSRRPDGKPFHVNGIVIEPNKILFDLGQSEVSMVGKVDALIQLRYPRKSGTIHSPIRVSSFSFSYNVTEDLSIDGEVTNEDKTIIERVVQDGPDLMDFFERNKPLVEGIKHDGQELVDFFRDNRDLVEQFSNDIGLFMVEEGQEWEV